MRYLLTAEIKEPIIENWQKFIKMGEERTTKGIGLGTQFKLNWHIIAGYKGVCVIDVDDEFKIAKWLWDFTPFTKVEAIPIYEFAEYVKRFPEKQ